MSPSELRSFMAHIHAVQNVNAAMFCSANDKDPQVFLFKAIQHDLKIRSSKLNLFESFVCDINHGKCDFTWRGMHALIWSWHLAGMYMYLCVTKRVCKPRFTTADFGFVTI